MPVPRRTLCIWIPLGLLAWAGLTAAAVAVVGVWTWARVPAWIPPSAAAPRVPADLPLPREHAPADRAEPVDPRSAKDAAIRDRTRRGVRMALEDTDHIAESVDIDEIGSPPNGPNHGRTRAWWVEGRVVHRTLRGDPVTDPFVVILYDHGEHFTTEAVAVAYQWIHMTDNCDGWLESNALREGNLGTVPKRYEHKLTAARLAARRVANDHLDWKEELSPLGSPLKDAWEIRRPDEHHWEIRGRVDLQDGSQPEFALDLKADLSPIRLRVGDRWLVGAPPPAQAPLLQ